MGSFVSKPKYTAPVQTPQVVYVPSTPAPAPAPKPDVTAPAENDVQKVAESIRRRSLPETVHTSYRGVLEQGEWVPQRKSLLGE